MTTLLLDTTVVIDALRGRPAAQRLRAARARGDLLCTSPVNVEEVHRGLFERERPAVERFFRGVRVVPIDRPEGTRAGDWRRTFAARGYTLSQADCLVAAAALRVDARLATGNPRHFPMEEVTVEHWPVGA